MHLIRYLRSAISKLFIKHIFTQEAIDSRSWMTIFIGTLAPIINAISYFWFTKSFSKVFVEIVFLNIDLDKVAVRTLETFRSDQNVLISFQMYFFFKF